MEEEEYKNTYPLVPLKEAYLLKEKKKGWLEKIGSMLTNWVQILFIIWFVLYTCGIRIKWFNLNDILYIVFYGYLLVILYQCLINKKKCEISFILLGIIIHYLPVYIYRKFNMKSDKYSRILMIIIIVLYLFYLKMKGKTVIDVYTSRKITTTFEELRERIRYIYFE